MCNEFERGIPLAKLELELAQYSYRFQWEGGRIPNNSEANPIANVIEAAPAQALFGIGRDRQKATEGLEFAVDPPQFDAGFYREIEQVRAANILTRLVPDLGKPGLPLALRSLMAPHSGRLLNPRRKAYQPPRL